MNDKEKTTPGLRVAPEYAGGTAAEASSDEWVVFGVDTVAQIAAENAARASGQSLGQWLSALIAETADKK